MRPGDKIILSGNIADHGIAIMTEVVDDFPGRVVIETIIGGTRIVDMLTGEQLPRIC